MNLLNLGTDVFLFDSRSCATARQFARNGSKGSPTGGSDLYPLEGSKLGVGESGGAVGGDRGETGSSALASAGYREAKKYKE